MPTSTKPFDMKADSFSFPTLYLLSNDIEATGAQLRKQVKQAPGFFRNTPVVFDLSRLPQEQAEVDFPMLVGLIRGQGMIPIGIRSGSPEQQAAAALMELAVLGEGRSEPKPSPPAEAAAPVAPAPLRMAETRIIAQPVRSGQKVYAAGGDLVVLAQVSPGAELMADGSIHVYGNLRGRVLAGVKGNQQARVFCRQLNAELVSVAGRYMISEDYPANTLNSSVQAYLDDDRLRIVPL